MSLKNFHIFFIVIATIACIFAGIWSWNIYGDSKSGGYLIAAILSFVFAAGLVVYGVTFLKKLKNID